MDQGAGLGNEGSRAAICGGSDDKSTPALRKSASSLRCLGRADHANLSVSVRAVAAGAHCDAAEITSALRRIALNLAKGENSLKIGVAAKRKRAGWDMERIRTILRLAR